MLVHVTQGPENPTRAALAFLVAKTAIDEGDAVTLFLAGDAVQLMRDGVLDSLSGLGTGKLRDSFDAIVKGGGRFYLSGMSSNARGIENDLKGKPAEFATPSCCRSQEHDGCYRGLLALAADASPLTSRALVTSLDTLTAEALRRGGPSGFLRLQTRQELRRRLDAEVVSQRGDKVAAVVGDHDARAGRARDVGDVRVVDAATRDRVVRSGAQHRQPVARPAGRAPPFARTLLPRAAATASDGETLNSGGSRVATE